MEDDSKGKPNEVYEWRGAERLFFKREAIERLVRFKIVEEIIIKVRRRLKYASEYI